MTIRRSATRSALTLSRRAATATLAASLLALTACNAMRSEADSDAPPMQMTPPSEHHQWLDQLVGEWEFTGEGMAAEGAEPMRGEGTMDVRSLGGLWIVGDTRGVMSGSSMRAQLTLGYDEERERYVGTWVDSVTSHLWHYEGRLDEARRTLPLEAEGPSMMDPNGKATYRDTIEIVGPDHWRLSSSMRQEDGSWVTFMTADYRRRG